MNILPFILDRGFLFPNIRDTNPYFYFYRTSTIERIKSHQGFLGFTNRDDDICSLSFNKENDFYCSYDFIRGLSFDTKDNLLIAKLSLVEEEGIQLF